MADEYRQRPVEGAPTHTTTIIHERRSGGGMTLIVLLILIVAVIGGVYIYNDYKRENTRDAAIAEAAGEVGAAASKVGDAAQDAVNSVK